MKVGWTLTAKHRFLPRWEKFGAVFAIQALSLVNILDDI